MQKKKRGGGWQRARVREKRLGMSSWANREPDQTRPDQIRSAVKPNAVKNAYRVDEGKGKREPWRKKKKNSLGGALSERYEGKGREEL